MLKRQLQVYDDLSAEEGELVVSCSSSSEAESDEEFSLKPSLPVGRFNSNFKETDEPISGEQYLCLVRHERKRLPCLEVAQEAKTLATRSSKTIQELISGFSNVGAVKELDSKWAECLWSTYQEHQTATWDLFAGVTEVNVVLPNGSNAEWLKFLQENKPSTEICVALQEEQETVMKLIHYYTNWIQSVTYTDLEWLSWLLVCLDRKLSSQQIYSLRRLVCALAVLENNEKATELVLIICKSYGQHDLVTLK
jgi:hypothetical protein